MENVVYILGAGFSAYAGLPLMNDFVSKSKDMYFDNIVKYKHFEKLFRDIDKLYKIKNYYQSNMFNIEEILSLMEMQQKLGETDSLRKQFVAYITDVINFYSPNHLDFKTNSSTNAWANGIIENNQVASDYALFVLSLLNGIVYKKNNDLLDSIYYQTNNKAETSYSVITFNYDLIIENILTFFNKNFISTNNIDLPIFKLHGCISKGNIIPPTWSKDISKEAVKVWKDAFSVLVNATKIRIIGYSLPLSDSYFRYFLKSSVIKNQRLKEIDIICYDQNGLVENNYNQFIVFDQKRYKNAKVEDYFNKIKDSLPYHSNILNYNQVYTYEYFERNHNNFMRPNT